MPNSDARGTSPIKAERYYITDDGREAIEG
jgi:hypothetical protein